MIGKITFLALSAVVAQPAAEMHVDFRNKQVNEQLFRLEKGNHQKFFTSGTEGLHIALKKGDAANPVGIMSQLQIRGNFDVTVNYELLKSENADVGWGSGFQVFLKLDSVAGDGLTIARQARGKTGHSVVFQHIVNKGGNRVSKQSRTVDVDPAATTGKIQLVREGPMLDVYYSSDSAEAASKHLGSFEVGADHVKMLRFAANPERKKHEVEVRILEVKVKADELKTAAAVAGEAADRSRWRMVLAAGVTILVVSGCGTCFWFWRSRSRLAGQESAAPKRTVPDKVKNATAIT